MGKTIVSMFTQSLAAVADWFVDVLAATQMTQIFLAAVFFVLLRKFILDPIFAGAGSDKVSNQKKDAK